MLPCWSVTNSLPLGWWSAWGYRLHCGVCKKFDVCVMCVSSKKAWFHSHDDVIGGAPQSVLMPPTGNNWIYYVIPPEQGDLFRKIRHAKLNAKPLTAKPQ